MTSARPSAIGRSPSEDDLLGMPARLGLNDDPVCQRERSPVMPTSGSGGGVLGARWRGHSSLGGGPGDAIAVMASEWLPAQVGPAPIGAPGQTGPRRYQQTVSRPVRVLPLKPRPLSPA